MHTEQGIQHLLAALQFGHSSDDLTRQLIHGSTEIMTMKLGTLDSPFTLDYATMHPLTTILWVKMSWQFQQHQNIWIKMDLPPLCASQTQDQYLKPWFVQSGISGAKLARINQCRIYLQVTTLADICDGSGEYILPDMWAGQPSHMFTTGYQWPNQGWPPKRMDTMATVTLTSLSSEPSTTPLTSTLGLAQPPTPIHQLMALDNLVCHTKTLPLDWAVSNIGMTLGLFQ